MKIVRPSLTAPPQPGCPAGNPGVGLLPDRAGAEEGMA